MAKLVVGYKAVESGIEFNEVEMLKPCFMEIEYFRNTFAPMVQNHIIGYFVGVAEDRAKTAISNYNKVAEELAKCVARVAEYDSALALVTKNQPNDTDVIDSYKVDLAVAKRDRDKLMTKADKTNKTMIKAADNEQAWHIISEKYLRTDIDVVVSPLLVVWSSQYTKALPKSYVESIGETGIMECYKAFRHILALATTGKDVKSADKKALGNALYANIKACKVSTHDGICSAYNMTFNNGMVSAICMTGVKIADNKKTGIKELASLDEVGFLLRVHEFMYMECTTGYKGIKEVRTKVSIMENPFA